MYRTIYESLNKDARVQVNTLSRALRVNRNSASKRLKEALELGYVLTPQLRKRSYANMKEYNYFVECERPLRLFKEYKDDLDVVYHAAMCGFANLWLTARNKVDVEGAIMVEGLRSDYLVAFAPNRPWEKAVETMRKKLETFSPEKYIPRGTIGTHWDECADWDSEDEVLSREFKYDMRKKITPIMRKNCISAEKIYEFFEKAPKYCTIFTRYFPESLSAYDPYLFMFETDYEDFVVDLFSELPTSPFFFKTAGRLFLYANVDRSSLREVGLEMADISQLHIPFLVDELLDRGIVKSEAHAVVEYSWAKNL